MTTWAERVTEWEARWGRLDPPGTVASLLDMARAGNWASPEHQAAYEDWAPHAGARLVDAIREHTGHDLLEDLVTADPKPTLDVTQPGALPPPPYTARPEKDNDDDWLAALRDDEERVSVYTDSHGRSIRLTHPGLYPPAAITMTEGVPAAPVEFLWKGDE